MLNLIHSVIVRVLCLCSCREAAYCSEEQIKMYVRTGSDKEVLFKITNCSVLKHPDLEAAICHIMSNFELSIVFLSIFLHILHFLSSTEESNFATEVLCSRDRVLSL
jgi:hypothetical protein